MDLWSTVFGYTMAGLVILIAVLAWNKKPDNAPHGMVREPPNLCDLSDDETDVETPSPPPPSEDETD